MIYCPDCISYHDGECTPDKEDYLKPCEYFKKVSEPLDEDTLGDIKYHQGLNDSKEK